MSNLDVSVHRWRKALANAAVGPLLIAPEIVQIANDWEKYKADAGGLTVSSFLRRELGAGHDLAFFKRRANAVDILGKDIQRVATHHEVAVWIVNNFEIDVAKQAMLRLANETRLKHNGNPLSLAQARPFLLKSLNLKTERRPRECARCKFLEEENGRLKTLLENSVSVSS